ncbi:alpha-lytic protease prodomain-containing protein [Streptomonospora sediminis]
MRKFPLIWAFASTAAALGLVVAGATTVADEERPAPESVSLTSSEDASHADTQLDALKRDLGLTKGEATALMQDEQDARATADDLRNELGGDFAGSRFDIESGELTIAVTDRGSLDRVRDAGATPRFVRHGEQVLNKAVDDLDGAGTDAPAGVTGWYPSTGGDEVVLTVLADKAGARSAAADFVAEAGVDPGLVRVEETEREPRTYADVVGGSAYYVDGSSRCSVGFATAIGFITAGHCGPAGSAVSSEDGSGSGTVTDSVFPGSDMAAVETDGSWTPMPAVSKHDGGTVSVAGSEEAIEGASVCRSGSTTGWHCGTIGAKNQTVAYEQGTVEGLTRTDVCAEPGDSGGSWVSGEQAQGVTSGGTGDCTQGGTTYFQPVNPILDEFGVNLLTS